MSRIAVVSELELFRTREEIAEVDGRRGIEHSSTNVVVLEALCVINLVHLRLHVGTDGQAIECAVDAQLQTYVVVLITVGRVIALCHIGLSHPMPLAIVVDGNAMIDKGLSPIHPVEDTGHRAIAVIEAIVVLVGHLQIELVPNGFDVGQTHRSVAVLGGCVAVLHLMINGISTRVGQYLVVIGLAVRLALAGALSEARVGIQGYVTSGLREASVDLQGAREGVVIALRMIAIATMVDAYGIAKLGIISQGVVSELVRVVEEGGTLAIGTTARGVPREVGAYHDVGHRVGTPFYAVLRTKALVIVRILVP